MPQPRDDNHRSSDDAVRIVQRRTKVARLMLDGVEGNAEIRMRLGMDPSRSAEGQRKTISRDKKFVLMVWRKSCVRDIDAVKARLVASLWHNYQQAMEAWHASKVKETETMKTGGEFEETQYKIEGSSGNPAYLSNAQKALVELAKLYGLYTEKVEARLVRQLEGWEPILEVMTDQEIAVLEVLAEKMQAIEDKRTKAE
jgi:hypothetical protein